MATRLDEIGTGVRATGPYADLDDRMLVLDFQSGNGNREPAFAEIHRRYSGLARHICYRILTHPGDAEDATQETMLRVLQGLGRFNGRYQLQPWIARIATNVSLDALRSRMRSPQRADRELLEIDQEADHASEPSLLVEQLLEGERVRRVLAEIPDHHRAALMLREFEGRSHEEIGRALGVTPSQAKALIHRAKGSFRRAWDKQEARQRRLAAFAPLFLLPLRASEWLRRLFGPAGDAAATATASPAVATTGTAVGERVTAAAVVVVMAATVGVGAVALRHNASESDQQRKSVVSAAPSPTTAPATTVVAAAVKPEPAKPQKVHKHGRAKHVKPGKTAPAVEVTPQVSPTPSPSPSPSETPPPTIAPPPPAPAWTGAFSASFLGDQVTLAQMDSKVSGTVGKNFVFSQDTTASYLDSNGADQRLAFEYWGSADGARGEANSWLFVDTSAGRYRYDGSLSLDATVLNDDGTFTYVYSGDYSLADAPAQPADVETGMPTQGTISLQLDFWPDQSLYGTSVSLTTGN